ncbi:MAG TPA: fibronectin type III domain-containing protein [Verrucomicrobiae bacterium]
MAGLFASVLIVNSTHAASVNLAWNKNPEPDVIGYKVHYGRSGTSPTNIINVANVTNTTISGLQAGTSYAFYASAFNSAGLESALSSGVSYTVPSTANNLVVTWEESFSKDAQNYAVFFGPPGQISTRLDAGTNLTATLSNVVRGSTYDVTVEAYDSADQLVTEYEVLTYTVPVSGTIGPVHLLPIDQPPSVALTSPADGSGFNAPATIQITANASDDDAVQFVDFFAGTNLLARVPAPPYSFTWNSVPMGQYEINAVAVDTSDQFTESGSATITVSSPTSSPPIAPANLAGRFNRRTDEVRLSWTDESNNESSFVIERSLNNSSFAPIATLPPNSTSYSDSALQLGNRYYYRVRAQNSAGANVSSTVSVRTRY